MILNGIDKIDSDGGEYLVLIDYCSEGLSVSGQFETLDEAIDSVMAGGYSRPAAIVQLVDITPQRQSHD